MLTGLGNGILTSSVYIVEVVAASRRGSVVMVSQWISYELPYNKVAVITSSVSIQHTFNVHRMVISNIYPYLFSQLE